MNAQPHCVTLEDLLKRLPLKKSRVYYLVHTNKIPYHHIGMQANPLPAEPGQLHGRSALSTTANGPNQ